MRTRSRVPNWLVRIEAPEGELERLSAELWSLGTAGVEEIAVPLELRAYFAGEVPRAELERLDDAARGVRVHGPVPVAERDWEREWRAGLAPRRIGALWVRPSFCASAGTPELVIDPQQAFGSGELATTRLALAAATLDALSERARFDLVVANLLLHELLPCLPRLARHARRVLVVSGYLASERRGLERAASGLGLHCTRESSEIQSSDRWCARVLAHGAARSAASSASSASSAE